MHEKIPRSVLEVVMEEACTGPVILPVEAIMLAVVALTPTRASAEQALVLLHTKLAGKEVDCQK